MNDEIIFKPFKTNVFQRNILNYVGEESKYISELDFYNAVKVSSDYPTAENVRDKEMK